MAPPVPTDPLPPPETRRWLARRKALIVAAVRSGRLTLEEACRRYALSIEEFLVWQRAAESEGLAGLQATASQRRRGRKETPADASVKVPGAPAPGDSGSDKRGGD
jgi:hypothetical protein